VTFRTRVAAAIAAVVAIAVLLACAVAYKAARDALEGSADSSLSSTYAAISKQVYNGGPAIELSDVNCQIVDAQGNWIAGYLVPSVLPVDDTVKQVAAGSLHSLFRTVTADVGAHHGYPLRELVTQLAAGTTIIQSAPSPPLVLRVPAALVLVEPFQGVQSRLESLGQELIILAGLGVLLAALFGWLVARAALVPLAATTREIEDVAATLDVSHRVEEGSDDELGRLRRAFNRLLQEVERSQDAQRQLILDASHELRTPLTSLRANAQVLGRLGELDDDDVAQLSDDMVTQVDELTSLVGDLTELTQGEHSVEEPTTFDLADLVAESTEIAETHARRKEVTFSLASSPCTVHARRNRVARAVGNLLDNAIKFSPPGGTVSVSCAVGEVVVEDQGPGIDEADLPRVFDRFYRSPRSRGLPGSGLGLAIVAQVAREADGDADAGRSDALGGARVSLRLPTVGRVGRF
jgi:two-component system sensor histidine kinase MprB